MSENTNYIDIEKLTEYFKTEEEKKKRKYDENLKKIEKRKMLLHDINLEINKILIENVKINDKDIEIFFDEKINGIKREIKEINNNQEEENNNKNKIIEISGNISEENNKEEEKVVNLKLKNINNKKRITVLYMLIK